MVVGWAGGAVVKVYLLEYGDSHLRCVVGVYSDWALARKAQLVRDPLADPEDISEFTLDDGVSERTGAPNE